MPIIKSRKAEVSEDECRRICDWTLSNGIEPNAIAYPAFIDTDAMVMHCYVIATTREAVDAAPTGENGHYFPPSVRDHRVGLVSAMASVTPGRPLLMHQEFAITSLPPLDLLRPEDAALLAEVA